MHKVFQINRRKKTDMRGGQVKSMASPQTENGFTRIANELLEAIYSTGFNGTQFKIILCIIRFTYGFGRKSHDMSISFISQATGISRRYISAELNKLIENNVVEVIQAHTDITSRILGLNKNYAQWLTYGTILPQVNNTSTGEQLQDTTGEELFHTPGEELFHQERKSFKESIKENNILDESPKKSEKELRKEVYDHYLSLGIIKHKKYTKAMDDAIKKAMKENGYTIEDCKELLNRHKEVVELTRNSEYSVTARPLHSFFGQKAYKAIHLICADYEEGGKYYNYSLKPNQSTSRDRIATINF